MTIHEALGLLNVIENGLTRGFQLEYEDLKVSENNKRKVIVSNLNKVLTVCRQSLADFKKD